MTETWRCSECGAIIDDEMREVSRKEYQGTCPYCGARLICELDTEGMWPDEDTYDRFSSVD